MPHPMILTLITVVLLLSGSWLAFYDPGRKKVRRRLRALAVVEPGSRTTTAVALVRRRAFSDIPWLNDLLVRLPLMRTVERLLTQANSPYGVGGFLLLSLLCCGAGFLLGHMVTPNALWYQVGAIVSGIMPGFYLYRRKIQRLRQFERQLPEALDLVARTLKAGNPFIVGMQMVGDEFSDPIGTEFSKTVDEINFGVSVPEALQNLARRIDCPDVLFFVTAVIVQRDVGGNLAEILEKTSQLIRQRFELHGRIQVLSAEGKLSAIILFALPFGLALVINLLNPGYLAVLFTDPVGKGMVGASGIMMLLGALVIRNMIRIKV